MLAEDSEIILHTKTVIRAEMNCLGSFGVCATQIHYHWGPSCISVILHQYDLLSVLSPCMQIIGQLPEQVALTVLSRDNASLLECISFLPSSLHPLSLRAQHPSLAQNASLSLDAVPDSVVRFSPPSTRCLLYTSPSPRDRQKSRMPSSA